MKGILFPGNWKHELRYLEAGGGFKLWFHYQCLQVTVVQGPFSSQSLVLLLLSSMSHLVFSNQDLPCPTFALVQQHLLASNRTLRDLEVYALLFSKEVGRTVVEDWTKHKMFVLWSKPVPWFTWDRRWQTTLCKSLFQFPSLGKIKRLYWLTGQPLEFEYQFYHLPPELKLFKLSVCLVSFPDKTEII